MAPRTTRKRKNRRQGKRTARRRAPKSGGARTPSRAGRKSTRRTRAAAERPETVPLEILAAHERRVSDGEQARRRADSMAGDEDPGGSVSVPEHDQVDQWAGSLGVERSPESPVRASAEILARRDRRRRTRRPSPTL